MGDDFQLSKGGGPVSFEGEIIDPGATPGDVLTIQDDGSVAAEAGGGSQPVIAITFDFAFDTAGLLAGLTVPGYTPKAGDLVAFNTRILPSVAWDGTTPFGDIYFGSATTRCFFTSTVSPIDMTSLGSPQPGGNLNIDGTQYYPAIVEADADVLQVAVSQDGTKGGADPGSSVGAATLYVVVFRPA